MIYKNGKTKNISFPLGGIGTGCIGLMGNGELNDWEIFNHPNKISRNEYSHFAIKAITKDKSIVKVLHGDTNENLIGTSHAGTGTTTYGWGPRECSLAGFPHFKNVTFDGNFPIARLTFEDEKFPATVRLCAFNPFIPHDEFNSSIPAAFFEWEIENTSSEDIDFALACTVANPSESSFNKKISENDKAGIFFGSADINDDDIKYSDLCVLTDGLDTDVQEYWYRGGWKDSCTMYWNNICHLDRMPERSYDTPAKRDHGTLTSYVKIRAGEKAKVRFIIAWNVPVAHNYWDTTGCNGYMVGRDDDSDKTWRNYYATQFKNSLETASYAIENFDDLYNKTKLFENALRACTLPDSVKDAVSANLSVLKSPTALRLENGSFWGWEGCFEQTGACQGSCQHVWNYAYAMPYLFPRLERSLRENNIKYSLQESGATSFRINLPPKKEMYTFRACVDGQMGEVIKCYREWKISGDDEWLKKHADSIFKMIEYAWSPDNFDKWDADMDGVLDGRQHHTLDMELFGASSWLEGLYLLALDCGEKMAAHLGDSERASLYSKLYQNGKKWMNDNLFNGKYFAQKVDLSNKSLVERFEATDRYWNDEAKEIKYQIADGCIIDQMLADWHAVLIGSDGVFDSDKKKIALENLYKNNYKPTLRDFANMWRNFALNDEAGTVICSYPEGAYIPTIPIPYCEDTMTGFEYALAGLMIAEGFVTEGESMVKAVRDRYDGEKRNPWNEIECGNNYARSMASFALLPIYSGFTFDMTKKHIGFNPINKSGRYLFSVAESWGEVQIDNGECRISMHGNPLTLSSISLPCCKAINQVSVDGQNIEFKLDGTNILLGDTEIRQELIVK